MANRIDSWLRAAVESALKDAVQKKKHLSLNDLQLREEVHIDHNHNWWIRINDAKKLRFLRRLDDKQKKILVSDDHLQIRATFSKTSIERFKAGTGRDFSQLHLGHIVIVEKCRLMLTSQGNPDDGLILFVESFSWIQGPDSGQVAHCTNLEQLEQIQNLRIQLLGPVDVVDLRGSADVLSSQAFSKNLISQGGRARQGQDLEMDRSVNLAPPIQLQSQARRPHDRFVPVDNGGSVDAMNVQERTLRLLSREEATKPAASKPRTVFGLDNSNLAVSPSQQRILAKPESWQYPLVDCSASECLLPPALKSKFLEKLSRRHGANSDIQTYGQESTSQYSQRPTSQLQRSVRPSQIHMHDYKSLQQTNPANQREDGRSSSIVSERSDEPIAWSPSPSCHRGDGFPVDSSNPEPNHQRVHTPPVARTASRNGSSPAISQSGNSTSDASTDMGLEESVPLVVGEDAYTNDVYDSDANRRKYPSEQDSPMSLRSQRIRQQSQVGKNLPGAREHVAENSSQNDDTIISQTHTSPTSQGLETAKLLQDSEISVAQRSGLGRRLNVCVGSPMSRNFRIDTYSQQSTLSPRSPKPEQDAQAVEVERYSLANSGNYKNLDLAYTSQDQVGENPVVTARRQRREFLQGINDAQDETSGSPHTLVVSLRSPKKEVAPHDSEKLSSSSQAKPRSGKPKSGRIDGNVSPPPTRWSIAPSLVSDSAVNLTSHEQEKRYVSNERMTAIGEGPPLKRRRTELTTNDAHEPRVVTSAEPVLSQEPPEPSRGIFIKFIQSYPDYSAGQSHLRNLCEDIDNLGKNLHKSLWDDYIVCSATRFGEKSGQPYKDFYDEHVEEPTHTKRIINPSTLAVILQSSQTVSMSNKSHASTLATPDSSRRSSVQVHVKNPSGTRRVSSYQSPKLNQASTSSPAHPPSQKRRSLPWQEALSPHLRPPSSHPSRLSYASLSTPRRASGIVGFGHVSSAKKASSSVSTDKGLDAQHWNSSVTADELESSREYEDGDPQSRYRLKAASPELGVGGPHRDHHGDDAEERTQGNDGVVFETLKGSGKAEAQDHLDTDSPRVAAHAAESPSRTTEDPVELEWYEQNTIFKEFAQSYSRLRIHEGVLGAAPLGRKEMVPRKPKPADVLSWKL